MINNIDWKNFAEDYFRLIKTEFNGLNLTALNSADEIYMKQVLDSVLPVEQSEIFRQKLNSASCIIDLGTGGGYPLLPIAKIYNNKKHVGIDARNKKLKAVLSIAAHMKLNNVKVLHSTFKDIIFDQANLVCVIKAVGKITEIIEQIYTMYDLDLFFYKGLNFYEIEIEELTKLKNNEQLMGVEKIHVNDEISRYLVHCQLKANVPRGTKNFANGKGKMFSRLI